MFQRRIKFSKFWKQFIKPNSVRIVSSGVVLAHWTCLLTEPICSVNLFSHWTCLLTEPVFSLNLFAHWNYLLTEPICSVSLFAHCTCFLTEPICSVSLFAHWTCLLCEPVCSLNLFAHWTCFLCEPVCSLNLFVPFWFLRECRSIRWFRVLGNVLYLLNRTSGNSVTHKRLSSTFTYFFRFLPIRFPPLPHLLLRPYNPYSFMGVSPALYTTISSFLLHHRKRNLLRSTHTFKFHR